MNVSNWFACSECGEPTDYKRKGDDGYYYGHCKKCGKVVRLYVDSEISTANSQDKLSTRMITKA